MLDGLNAIWRALALLKARPRLLFWFMLGPWSLNLVIFLGIWSASTAWMTRQVDSYIAGLVTGWWHTLLTGAISLVAVLLAGALAYLVTMICAMLLAAPLYDALSRATEQALALGGATTNDRRLGMVAAYREGAKTALVLLVAETLLLLVNLLPVGGTPLFVLGSGVALTLGFLDVPLSRRDHPLSAKVRFVATHFGAIFGLSLVVGVVSVVPLLNLLTTPLVVMAATLLVADRDPVRP